MAAGKKRGGNRLLIIIILIIAVGAVLAYVLLTNSAPLTGGKQPANQSEPTAIPVSEMVDIVIASQSIPRGSIITSDFLTTIKYPSINVPQHTFFTSIEEVVGKKAKYNIEPAVPITTNMVIEGESGSNASFDIPIGMTAFAIPVTPETNVAFAPQKGDHVMVVGCMLLSDIDTDFQTRLPNNVTTAYSPPGTPTERGTPNSISIDPVAEGSLALYGRYELDPTTNSYVFLTPSESQRPRLVCQTIIQDAAILQVGMFELGKSTDSSVPTPVVVATEAVNTSNSGYPGSVTLIVTPQDTLILNYLLLSGTKLSLALRSSSDSAVITTDPVTLQYIMDHKNIPSPVKMPYSVEPRVDSLVYPGFNDYILLQP